MQEAKYPLGILVGVDESPESDAAVRWAAAAAGMRGLPLTLMHAIPPVNVSWPVAYLEASYVRSQDAAAREMLEKAQQTAAACAGDAPPVVRTEVAQANAAAALVGATREAYMTVVGSRGMGALGRAILGSVSGALVHHGRGPIAIIRAEEGRLPDPGLPVLLGIDGSPASEDATALAFDEACRRRVGLVALHAWSDVSDFPMIGMDWQQQEAEGHRMLAERLAGWQERYPGVDVARRIECDQPSRWLIEASQQAQLVVVSSHGRGGFIGKVLGSVASKVAHAAKAPVIVVRAR